MLYIQPYIPDTGENPATEDRDVKTYDFTERELQAVKLLIKAQESGHGAPYTYIAGELRITAEAVRQLFFRLRNRYDAAMRFTAEYRRVKAKIRGRRFL